MILYYVAPLGLAAVVFLAVFRRITIFETPELQLVGITIPNFWRKTVVPVRVGDRVESGAQLLQLWVRANDRAEEVLVLYPQDGYWRLRPMAPQGLAPTAYGSSFLIGPVDVEQRPIVKMKEVAFEPKTKTFTLAFERGGSATVAMTRIDQNVTALDVVFDRAIDSRPFAALRSMYVTEFNNDVARIAVLDDAGKGWREEAIMSFKRATATRVWLGRASPSRHNTSAPDMAFQGFTDTGK